MKTKSKLPADQPCQLFEFLLRMTGGTEVFVYTIPEEDADRLSSLFDEFDALTADRQFLEFASVSGRVIHLNLKFLVGVSRLELVGRVGDQDPVEPTGSGAGIHGWQSLSDPRDAPDLALFIDGLQQPVICGEVAPDEIQLAVATLQDDPATAIVSFFDDENLRTRFIPARNIILMDSTGDYEADPPSDEEDLKT